MKILRRSVKPAIEPTGSGLGFRSGKADAIVPYGPIVGGLPSGRAPSRLEGFLRLHPKLLATLAEGRRFCHRADPSIIRGLKRLDARAQQQLRDRLQAALEPTLRAATKRHPSFIGRANVGKIMDILSGEIWRSKLDWTVKQFQRTLRDQNVDSLIGRHALSLVHGKGGLFAALNPGSEAHPEGFEIDLAIPGVKASAHGQGPIEQRYALLEASVGLFGVGFTEAEIKAFAAESQRAITAERGWAPKEHAERAMRHFLGLASLRTVRRHRHVEELPRPQNLGVTEARVAAERLSRVRWIESQVPADAHGQRHFGGPELYRDDLARLFKATSAEEVFEALDVRFEAAMAAALARGQRAPALTGFQTVRFERMSEDRVIPGAAARVEAQTTDAMDLNYQRLDRLRARLEAGEVSAIGGKDYASQTFPEELLLQVARGLVTVLAYDGAPEEALEYARNRFGIKGEHRSAARTMGLQGLYGSYPRRLLTFEDGSHVLVLSGFGKSRQLNNAASMLLVHDEEGRRIPAEKIVLATSTQDLRTRFGDDLARAIRADFEAHGGKLPLGADAKMIDDLPTRLLVVQNPAHLEEAYRGRFVWGPDVGPTAIPLRIGYVRHEDGRVERVIVPKVGGGGLYGDNAGKFVEAFFGLALKNLSPDVIFSGTAGGFNATDGTPPFAGTRGLPKLEPGGIIVPLEGIGELESERVTKMVSLFGQQDAALTAALEASGAHLTGRHVAVPAPAIETYTLVAELVARGFASVDVEGAEILKAIQSLRAQRPELTFTPVYHHSDDPRASEADRYQSLAMTGPFFEGARFPAELYGLITALVSHSARPK